MGTILTPDLNFQKMSQESSLFPSEQLLSHHTPYQTIAVIIQKLKEYDYSKYSAQACRDYFKDDGNFEICMEKHPFTQLLYSMWENSSFDYIHDQMGQLLTKLSLDFIKDRPANVFEYELAIKFIFDFVIKSCYLEEEERLVYEVIYSAYPASEWEFTQDQYKYITKCSDTLTQDYFEQPFTGE